jgi:acetyltransferase-like isoleucine patch superfamily enzyme
MEILISHRIMIIRIIKDIVFRLKIQFADSYTRASLYGRKLGIKFGNDVRITGRPNWGSEPYLIEIGNHVSITQRVTFHTHDGGVWVFRDEYPNIDVFGKIVVGNNVFIGANVELLPGITIGDNVVIGAGSVVTKNIPDNVVVVGVPAKIIKSIDEYKKSSLDKSIQTKNLSPKEKKKVVIEYFKKDIT